MKILAVDDEPHILEVLSTALSTMGAYDVDIATSGAEALRMIDDDDVTYDCFLLDIQMPNMNGVTLCNEIRRHDDYARSPILMLTAMSQVKYIDQAFSAGATDYVTKPFDFKQLRSRMAQARRLASRNAWIVQAESEAARHREVQGTSEPGAFSHPVSLPEDAYTVGHGELENYVSQITRTDDSQSWGLAAKLQSADRLYEELALHDFKRRLGVVIGLLVKGLGGGSTLVSYRGSGVLLCVGHGAPKLSVEECERRVNALLSADQDDGAPVRVVFGERRMLDAPTIAGNMDILMRCVEDAEVTNDRRTREVTVPRRLLSFRRRTSQETHLERRAYEVILEELLDGSMGTWERKH